MDDVDRNLIRELTVDGRCSVNELASRVGVGRATAYERLARLRRNGVIKGYTVRVDHKALDLSISALLLVKVEQRYWRRVQSKLQSLPGIEWIGSTAGEFDFVALVRTQDIDTLRDVVVDRLQDIEGVSSNETVLLLEDHEILRR